MIKYLTAVGKVNIKSLTARGMADRECDFCHVVVADDPDEAVEKVIDYYSRKSNYDEQFGINVIEIFDFIA